ncbi:glucose 1-dehydrogenase [Paenibacillus antri]|uniref:Glucose 1-dehydrogenase n=1 Tax=Paenibacillus antri TaxID=2582848 RepID=A0A5R9GE51_9BACL|nr:glucose 1-dehydrogenase [Paenibacillus antri]TLS54051.1 glucose 1-dehydrogenase [Paenibacillus antri]
MRLIGKTAIVTGAGRGIGRGIAIEFAKEGATVIVATLVEEEGRQVVQEIADQGGRAVFVQVDVASEDSVRDMVRQAAEAYGGIDVLVNNAGITLFKPLLEATLEDWDAVMNIDLRGVFLCSKYVAAEMTKRGAGAIVNISSNHAKATLPDTELYAAAKAGVNGLTRSMALSLGKSGIRVNAICPGFTDTPHYRAWLESQGNAREIEQEVAWLHAGSRIASPSDIGKLAIYLASDEAEMVTGAEIVIDGGLSARLYHSRLC